MTNPGRWGEHPIAILRVRRKLSFEMRVLLKRKGTGHYYRDANQFAIEPSEALDFANVPAAAQFALTKQLPEVEIVLRWDSLAQEIPLPVLREWGDLDENRRPMAKEPSPASPAPSLAV